MNYQKQHNVPSDNLKLTKKNTNPFPPSYYENERRVKEKLAKVKNPYSDKPYSI